MKSAVFLGIDLGTSGVRGSAIDPAGSELATASMPLPAVQQPSDWQRAAFGVIRGLVEQIDADAIAALAIDGTSGTVLLCDDDGTPRSKALMYNDQRCAEEAAVIDRHAPGNSAARGTGSALARVLRLLKTTSAATRVCHQADWLTGLLCGRFDVSDENNALKTGYDPLKREWPAWLAGLDIDAAMLPRVCIPGSPIAPVSPAAVQALGLPAHCIVAAGTTDSIAAFIATGASGVGDAVTSLGSTLVLKLISDVPVYDSRLGVYSHRLGDIWLAGGASNSGGKVLLRYFDQARLDALTPLLNPDQPTGLDYYPLAQPGERFPRNDPGLQPQLEPRPADDLAFFQGLLEGMAAIEAEGYRKLAELGAPAVNRVFTAGGGSRNPAWRTIREHKLQVPVLVAAHSEASYGAALLAQRALA